MCYEVRRIIYEIVEHEKLKNKVSYFPNANSEETVSSKDK